MTSMTLGRYRVLSPLGEGGMGKVYLAEDPVLGRRLAVKVLPEEFTHDADRRERLLHEARAASALNHPNIVVVHDAGETEGRLWIAMERIEGETLRTWGTPRKSPAEILKVVRQAVRALAVAHEAGLVHRDLKPENLMVRTDGILKILDFGLARSVSHELGGKTATMPGTILGTAPYMSPEQVLGQTAGPPSDLFSLGTILYELITGRHPFRAGSAVETMHQILHETPANPSAVNPALTPDFDFVLGKVLSKDPTRRHASARDLDNDLDTLECGCLASGPPAGEPGPAAGPRAIAVLPFKNIGGDKNLAFLGVGLADAVITRLATSPDLVVRAISSVLPFEDQAVDPRHVGQTLDVTAVLDASFQRVGDRFRATARLIETPSGRSLWAGKVDVRNEDIFEVQDQVAQGIAEALTARVTAEDDSTPGAPHTPKPEAFERLVRARESARASLKGSYLKAIEYLEEAVKIDPGYALAWVDLGRMYHSMIDGGYDSDPAWYGKSEQALREALRLDAKNPEAVFAWGAHQLVRGNKPEAYAAFCESARRMPNNWLVWHYAGYLFRLCGMLDQAAAAEEHAVSVDPSSPWPYWALVRIHAFRHDEALAREWLERCRIRFGNHPRGLLMEFLLLSHLGRHVEIVAAWDRSHPPGSDVTKDTEFHALWFYAGFALFQCGRREEGKKFMLWAAPEAEVDMDAAMEMACGFAHMGERDKAFRALDRATELGQDLPTVYGDPARYGPLHGDPRWPAFLDRVERRVARWNREFRWPLPAA
ncbi:MAG TPA: protein kinase [Acidobacteriota bacterium]|nr:protein kinase [Acidobacteriota bacterium]